MPDEPGESISQQDNAGPKTAVENASQSITPSDNGDSPVDANDDGDNYPANCDVQSKGNNCRHKEELSTLCVHFRCIMLDYLTFCIHFIAVMLD